MSLNAYDNTTAVTQIRIRHSFVNRYIKFPFNGLYLVNSAPYNDNMITDNYTILYFPYAKYWEADQEITDHSHSVTGSSRTTEQ